MSISGPSQGNATDIALRLLLTVVVLTTTASFAYAITTPQPDPTYTEASLLTQNSEGEFVAANYTTEFSEGEATNLHFRIENHERETVKYTVFVQLQRVDGSGTLYRQLSRHQRVVPPGEAWQQPHEVTLPLIGDQLRLTYLVYKGTPPETQTVDNAYRSLTLWVEVSPSTSAVSEPDDETLTDSR